MQAVVSVSSPNAIALRTAPRYPSVPYGVWSDDGSQLMCVLASLTDSSGQVVLSDIAMRLLEWRDAAYMQSGGIVFDIGRQTANALSKLSYGVSPENSGGIHENSNGNGSLMRVLPLALATRIWGCSLPEVIEGAMAQSRITHAHPVSQVVCALYAVMGSVLTTPLDSSWASLATVASTTLETYFQETQANADLQDALHYVMQRAKNVPTGSGYVVDSFWSAIYALDKGAG